MPHAILLPTHQHSHADTIEGLLITEPSRTHFTTEVTHHNEDNISLPITANIGFVRPMTAEDRSDFRQAAENTSKQLSSVWSILVQCQYAQFQPSSANSQPKQRSSKSKNKSNSWKVSDQQIELEKAGLDSSILTPYREYHKNDVNPDNELPPTNEAVCFDSKFS